MIELTGQIRIEKTNFKGKDYVNIRKWFTTESGENRPTQKGITMSLEQWDEFCHKFEAIKKDLNNGR